MNPSVSHNAVSRSHSIGASKYVIGALVLIIGLFAMFFLRQPTFAQEDSVIVYESVCLRRTRHTFVYTGYMFAEQSVSGRYNLCGTVSDPADCTVNALIYSSSDGGSSSSFSRRSVTALAAILLRESSICA